MGQPRGWCGGHALLAGRGVSFRFFIVLLVDALKIADKNKTSLQATQLLFSMLYYYILFCRYMPVLNCSKLSLNN